MLKTNNCPRPILYWWDLTEKEREWLDYLDTEEKQESGQFFRYKGEVYDLGEFTTAPHDFIGWHGIQPDTFFSAVLVKYSADCGSVIIGYLFT